MKIELHKIKVRDLANGYEDNGYDGIVGYGGRLDIRPAYQREFKYKGKPAEAVIDSIRKEFPLNVMYWAVNKNGYEVLDGQQRTISICDYVEGNFPVNYQYFHNLTKEEQEQILNYELLVYFCEGDEREKLEWFETINIASMKLTKQELRNATYPGPWLYEAKRRFSLQGCPAYQVSKDYVRGIAINQDLLERAIKWISNGNIEQYMADHQHDDNCDELWNSYLSTINWVKDSFPTVRKEMKSVDWGKLYNHALGFPAQDYSEQVDALMMDDEIQKKAGIYPFLITGDQKYLNLRTFTDNQKREAFERQGGVCPKTGKKFNDFTEMHADHIEPWSKGGKTVPENLMMVCPKYNLRKSNKF